MKKPRVVPFSVDGTEPPNGNYYPSVDRVKGGAFLDTKTSRVYVVTADMTCWDFIANEGAENVEDTIRQHGGKL